MYMLKNYSQIEKMMADTDFDDDPEQIKKISLEYEKLKTDLTEKMHKWEEIAG